MKTLGFIVSVLLLTVIPSVLIYTFFDVYLNIHPMAINIITGSFMFIMGGVLVARGNNQKKDEDGGTTK